MQLESLGRKLGNFTFFTLVLGAGMLIGGVELSLSPMTGAGVLFIGLALMLGGLGDVLTRYAHESSIEGSPSFTYRGASAVAYGVSFILIGGIVVVGALAYTVGLGDQLLDYVFKGPGIVLVWLGLLGMSKGFVSLVGAVEENPRRSLGRFLMSLPGRLGGLFIFVLGVAGVAAGGLKMFAPQTLDQVVRQLGLMPPPGLF